MTQDFGEKLRKLRILNNLSQDEMARKIDLSLSTYSRIERNEVAADFDTVVKLSNVFKMTLDEFHYFGDPEFKVDEAKQTYQKKWSVPITVSLDGTSETLETWVKRLTAINAAI